MRQSLSVFVESPGNAEALKAFKNLNSGIPIQLEVIVEGPKGSGKSALVKGIAEDAVRNGEGMTIFACSGADIALALMDESNDFFFENLGERPILVIDDLASLVRVDKGDQLLSLLIDERRRLGLSTAIMLDEPLSSFNLTESADRLESFRHISISPLDNEGKAGFVRMVENEYRKETSPSVDDEAVAFIVEAFGASFADMENAMRYLMTDEDCSKLGAIDAAIAEKLLNI